METQPIPIQAAVIMLLNGLLTVANLTFYPMTPAQLAAWETVIIAAVAIGAWWATRLTTAKAKPEDDDGTPLVRADTYEITARAKAAGRSLIVAQGRGDSPRQVTWSEKLP